MVFHRSSVFCFYGVSSAGGGEVSGGGTLYMKWGADNNIVTSAVYGERENIVK